MMNTIWFKSILLTLFMLPILGILVVADHGRVAQAQTETTTPDPVALGPNCRYGVTDTGANEILPEIGVGWTLSFRVANATYPNNIEKAQIVRFKPQGSNGYVVVSPTNGFAGLDSLIASKPGSLWLIGNEVDRKDVQDDLYPEAYARAYHDTYYYIKQRDATARIAVAGLVRVSAGRLQYLDLVWDNYQRLYGQKMPVDVWNMHAYNIAELNGEGGDGAAAVANGTDPGLALRYLAPGENVAACNLPEVVCFMEEDDPQAFADQVVAMRQWMKNKGEQNKPLIISEYSILAPYNPADGFLQDENGNSFVPERVVQFLQATYGYLEGAADPELGYPADNNRLVQQWMWYTTIEENPDYVGSSSAFVNPFSLTLNQIGAAHRDWVAARPLATNLIMDRVDGGAGVVKPPGVTGSASIYVRVRNNGNTLTTSNTAVFIRDADGNNLGTAQVAPGVGGCGMDTGTAVFTINNLPPGFHTFTAHIQNSNAPEKVGSATVFIGSDQLFLPIMQR
ncbi:MAG: hypothetical protein KDD89_02785 [Anaerolineales bacterium]|nr:hypothetical protein [Anaerolineales bacterium]